MRKKWPLLVQHNERTSDAICPQKNQTSSTLATAPHTAFPCGKDATRACRERFASREDRKCRQSPPYMTVADFFPDAARYASSPTASSFSTFSSTSLRASSWNLTSLDISTGSPPQPANIRAASRPAFLAFPMATVATGTPLGICTMLYKESTPDKAEVLTGTPITGSAVKAATMPGKWAAPPAPATMQRNPRLAADLAYAIMRSGVRCAETTVHS
mmetsp:Transcript_77733/g.237853  ORF Transcript_77733/g.237853 Transcript_77733/m.237853 type:complete len:216 (+) Transcript_77733:23-670(+)